MNVLWHFAVGVIVFSIVTVLSFIFLPTEKTAYSDRYHLWNNPTEIDFDFQIVDNWVNTVGIDKKDLANDVVLVVFFDINRIESAEAMEVVALWNEQYKERGFQVIGMYQPDLKIEFDDAALRSYLVDKQVVFPVAKVKKLEELPTFKPLQKPGWRLYSREGEEVFRGEGELNYRSLERKIIWLLQTDHYYSNFLETSHANKISIKPPKKRIETVTLGNNQKNQLLNADNLPKKFDFEKGVFYHRGGWEIVESAISVLPDATNKKLEMRLNHQKMYLLMSPKNGKTNRVFVKMDGKPIPKEKAGEQINYDRLGQSFINVYETKLYSVVDSFEKGEHVIEITPETTNLSLYRLTVSD